MSVYITFVRGQLKHAHSLEENQAAHNSINDIARNAVSAIVPPSRRGVLSGRERGHVDR